MESDTLNQVIDWVQYRKFGKYRGTVADNEDPTHRGRLKVKVPDALGDIPPVWAMPCVPYAGPDVGAYAIPPIHSGVWVEFENGLPSYPIWTGTYWSDDELPKDETGTRATPPLKIIRSWQGLMVTMDDDSQVITVSDKDGTNLIKIAVTNGQITVQGASKVVVESPQIELVENATHPVVFGDVLMTYLSQIVAIYQAHTHPGELALGVLPVTPAPPVPPMQPPTPDLISTRVKSG